MKKIIYLFIVVSLITQSCVKDEDDLFDQSSANRMAATLAEYNKILQDSQYGWVMDYYPDYEQSYGGFNYIIKFASEGNAIMMTEVGFSTSSESYPAGTEMESLYKLLPDQGPILTFDTYNLLFHYFSEPKGSSNIDGYAGDYEFVFMEVEADRIRLKGKKHGNNILMTKLTEPAEDYIEKVLKVAEIMDATPRMKMVVSGKNLGIRLADRILQYTAITEDNTSEIKNVAYIYKPNGIKLYEPIEIEGETADEFILNIEENILVSINGNMSMPAPGLIESFCLTDTQWWFDFDIQSLSGNMCAALLDIFDEVNEANFLAEGEIILNGYLGRSHVYGSGGDYNTHSFVFYSSYGSGGYYLAYGYNMIPDYSADLRVNIELTGGGYNWSWYTHFQTIMNFMEDNSPYDIEFDDIDNPMIAKFVSVANPEMWFVVEQ